MLATCSLGGLHRWPLCSSSLCGFIMICQFSFFFLGVFLDSTCWPFSPQFLLWLSLILVARCFLGPFLPLEFSLRFGWSSGRFVAFCVPLAWLPSLSGSDVPFTCLGFSVAFPRCFLSCAFAFRSSSRLLLLVRGFGCPVLTSFLYF